MLTSFQPMRGAVEARKPAMSVLKRTQNGKSSTLALQGAVITLGRGTECHIKLQDPAAARLHCQLVKTEKGYLVRDLVSQTGTFVNGKKVNEQLLREGDTIKIGGETFQYSAAAAAPAGGGTAKIATGTQRVPTGNTQRIAAPAPAAKAPTGNTQRLAAGAKPAAAGTARISTGTQKVAAGARTSTGAVPKQAPPPAGTSSRRLRMSRGGPGATSRSLRARTANRPRPKPGIFHLPESRKARLVFLFITLGCLTLGGIFGWLWYTKPDLKKIKEELASAVKALPEDTLEKEKALKAILDVDKYRLVNDYNAVRKMYDKVKEMADVEREAAAKCGPFLEEFEKIKAANGLKVKAPDLLDPAKALKEQYVNTSQAEKMTLVYNEIRAVIEGADTTETDIMKTKFDAEGAARKGNLKESLEKIKALQDKFRGTLSPENIRRINDIQETSVRLAGELVEAKVARAAKLCEDKKVAEAMEMLNGLKPGLDGEPLKALEKGIADLKTKFPK